MRIAQIAPPFECVPPARYGGTETVIANLVDELVRRGHEVTLFASGDSNTLGRLVPVVERALWHDGVEYRDPMTFCATILGRVASQLDEFDVIHNHMDYLAFPLARLALQPVVTTLHGRLDLPEHLPLYREFDDVPLISISNAQRLPVPDARWVATVPHGINIPDFTWSSEPGRYLAFLGRISPDKGVDTAIRVAARAGMPLKIAARMPLPGGRNPEARLDQEYYEDVVKPLLDGEHVEFIGEVGGAQKNEFLRNAAALLFPIQWPEPFGLVMIEAMASGTPVIALARGSVPEVVADGITGFVCTGEDHMVRAVARIGEIERARCREEATTRFSAKVMARRYERIYEGLCQIDAYLYPRAVTSEPALAQR